MREAIKWALFAAFCGMIGWTLCMEYGPNADPEHHWHEAKTVRVDTFASPPIHMPVPGPERTRIDTFYPDGAHSVVLYVPVTDTVYADCDSAKRYNSEYSDSLVRIEVSSDICGKLLASQIKYECYQRTVTRNVTSEGRSFASRRLYATASSTPGIGLAFATSRCLVGYTYQPGTAASSLTRAHLVTLGMTLWTIKKRHNGTR